MPHERFRRLVVQGSVALRRWVRSGCMAVWMTASLTAAYGLQTESVKPMARDAHPSFEVATIKLSDPADQSHRFTIQGRRILIENQTVRTMIEMSYGIHARQIENAPPWFETERFDVRGLPDGEGQPNVTQFQEMLRKLLAERFGLKVHMEKQEMARYTLTVAKGGPKMEPTKSAPDALPEINGNTNKGIMLYQMTNVSIGDLAHNLQGMLDKPVVNETGLQGKFDFNLKWAREDAPAAPDPENNVPGLFTAIQEQLGLKLEPSKGEVEMLVIDHAEHPSPN